MAKERQRQKRIAKKRARRREKRVTKQVAYLRRSIPRLPLEALATVGLPKMSDTIVEFAQPLLEELLEDANDPDEVRAILLLASTFWNMTLAADDRRAESGEAAAQALREDLINRLERALERPRSACQVLVDEMERRKRDLFPDDLRFVMEIDAYSTEDGVRVLAASRL
jgi:hypothetical protein